MVIQGITRACLATLVALTAATSCDVEPEGFEAEDLELRDDEPTELLDEEPDAATDEVPDELVEIVEPSEPEPLFPTANCRNGFINAGARLCISQVKQNATQYRHAARRCRANRSQVCSYEDLTYLYYNSQLDANYNPNASWIGNMVADDQVFCGNKQITFDNDPDIVNFEGTCNKGDVRGYWCCHDDE